MIVHSPAGLSAVVRWEHVNHSKSKSQCFGNCQRPWLSTVINASVIYGLWPSAETVNINLFTRWWRKYLLQVRNTWEWWSKIPNGRPGKPRPLILCQHEWNPEMKLSMIRHRDRFSPEEWFVAVVVWSPIIVRWDHSRDYKILFIIERTKRWRNQDNQNERRTLSVW